MNTASAPSALPEREQIEAALAALEGRPGHRVEAAEERARELERAAEACGAEELFWRARLVRADATQRQGRLAESLRLMREVNEYARVQAKPRLLARTHLLLAWAYRELGDVGAFLEHAVDAVDLLDEEAPQAMRAQHLLRLADALHESGSMASARERYAQAEVHAARAGDVVRQINCLNNLAYAEYQSGDLPRARAVIERLERLSERTRQRLSANTLDTISRIQSADGRFAEAEVTARRCLRTYQDDQLQEADAWPEYLVTLAIAQRGLGDLDGAQESLDRSSEVCERLGLAWLWPKVLAELAELAAARGDFRSAFLRYKEFYAAERATVSEQRDAQARLRQSMFEVTEARREAHRFHDQARRDPLTGLRNRRYVDEELPGFASTHERPVVVALLDLDHFKRVNDTLSHQVGDQVLVVFARMLAAAVPGSQGTGESDFGFAARIGGEEFLMVLGGLSREEALGRLEALRADVAAHDWSPLTGHVPVTVSIGVAWTDEDAGPRLLREADARLYSAKNSGRNRLCSTESVSAV